MGEGLAVPPPNPLPAKPAGRRTQTSRQRGTPTNLTVRPAGETAGAFGAFRFLGVYTKSERGDPSEFHFFGNEVCPGTAIP